MQTTSSLMKTRLLCPQMTFWLYNKSKNNLWFVVLEAVLVLKKVHLFTYKINDIHLKGLAFY
jgi:hypothetical protein